MLQKLDLATLAEGIELPYRPLPLVTLGSIEASLFVCDDKRGWHRNESHDQLMLVLEGVISLDGMGGKAIVSEGELASIPSRVGHNVTAGMRSTVVLPSTWSPETTDVRLSSAVARMARTRSARNRVGGRPPVGRAMLGAAAGAGAAAGVDEKDLDIALHSGVLTVSGSRQSEERKEGESYALYERQYGSFSRSFALPDIADGERIDASLHNGVLTLTIAKKAEAKPRKIELKK